MKKSTAIYVVTHKEVNMEPLKLDQCYKLIRVGAYGKQKSVMLSDHTGDNIAEKNPNYCELTAVYWIWKNDAQSDIVGLCHYRRFFTTAALSDSPQYILSQKKIEELLEQYDVIAPRREYSYRGAYQAYLDCGREKDIQTTERAIWKICPEYSETFRTEFKESPCGYPANMMICRREIFDQYCAWLFEILAEVEKNTDLEGYSAQEARIYGYLSERLFGVWLAKQHLRIKEMRVINTEQEAPKFRELTKWIGLEQLVKKIVFQTRKEKRGC